MQSITSKNNWLNEKHLFLVYILVWITVSILPGSKMLPPLGIAFMQFFLTAICIVAVFLCKKLEIRAILFIVFAFHLFATICLRLFYIEEFNDPLGSVSIDSAEYNRLAVLTCRKSFSEHIRYLIADGGIDDLGFPTILYCAYRLAGPEFGIHLMLLFNSIFVTVSCYYLYKLSVLFLPKNISVVITAYWGLLPFSVTTAADGLKENFFTVFLIIGVYYAFVFCKSHNYLDLTKALFGGSLTLFFRLAVLPIFLAFLFVMFVNTRVKSSGKLVVVIILIALVFLYLLPSLFQYILDLRGFSLDTFTEMAELQYGTTETSHAGLLNWVFGIIGSLPSFLSTSDKINYITVNNFSPFLTLIIGSYYIWGIIEAVKTRSNVLPLAAITLLNSLIIIMMSFTFDYRYRFVHMPFALIIAGHGFCASDKKIALGHKFYRVLILLFIIYYNIS